MLSRKKKKIKPLLFSLLGNVQPFIQAPECELRGICSGVMPQLGARGDHRGGGVPNPQIQTLSLPSCGRNLENALPEHPMGPQEGWGVGWAWPWSPPCAFAPCLCCLGRFLCDVLPVASLA